MDAGDRAAVAYSAGLGTVRPAVPDPWHTGSIDQRRGRDGIRRRARRRRPARRVRAGGRRGPRVLRLEAERHDESDVRAIWCLLRGAHARLLRVGVELTRGPAAFDSAQAREAGPYVHALKTAPA